MGVIQVILYVLCAVFGVSGAFISLRGMSKSWRSDALDYRSYFVGLALILIAVGAFNLAQSIEGAAGN